MTDKVQNPDSARNKLLNAARVLFYQEGIHGTGIDSIVKRAGVAKKSLYNNFRSKDELIFAYLEVRHEEWLTLYRIREQQADTPRKRVMAVFTAYTDHAELAYELGFRGCGLLNAAAEFPADAPSRQIVCKQKEEIEDILFSHLITITVNKPQQARTLARHISFLLEGSITRAGLEGNSGYIIQASDIAEKLLEVF